MANEAIVVWGTEKTLEANGGSCASAAIVQANDATYAVVADGASFTDASFTLRCQWATITSIENKTIDLYARDLNIDSTNDAIAPTATFTHRYIGSFRISAVAANTDQYMHLRAYDVPKEAEYYIINSSGQTISAGWTLKVTPRTIKPAA
jgi:hypothetical protein